MSLKPTKYYPKILIVLILTGLTLLLTLCSRDEDSEEIRKEAITLRMNSDISADTLEALVYWMQDMGTRFALTDNHRNVALKIRNRFKTVGYPDTRIDSFLISKTYLNINYQQWQYNVIATIKGNSNPDSVVLSEVITMII
jgi:hypothetical protein